MSGNELELPEPSSADRVHALIKGAISSVPLVGGVGAEIFSMLLVAPVEKRRDRWIREVAARLNALEIRSSADLTRLASDESFVSVLARASQAAVLTADPEKVQLLAAAVENAAAGADIAEDTRLLFVRYIDELTVSHFRLLAGFRDGEQSLSRVESYVELQARTREVAGFECGFEEFKLFCNDLTSRVLIRINQGLADFPDISEPTYIAAEGYGNQNAPNFRVTSLGHSLLHFVADRRAESGYAGPPP